MAAKITFAQLVRTSRPARAMLEGKDAETEVELRTGEYWQAAGNNRWRAIVCLEGRIWITQVGDVQDHEITAGEMFLVSQPGKVIAQALVNSRMTITPCLATTSFRGRFEDTIFQ
jgi:hypothetical protein